LGDGVARAGETPRERPTAKAAIGLTVRKLQNIVIPVLAPHLSSALTDLRRLAGVNLWAAARLR
jgi:hypothetical protein